jgi:hypothetical protein
VFKYVTVEKFCFPQKMDRAENSLASPLDLASPGLAQLIAFEATAAADTGRLSPAEVAEAVLLASAAAGDVTAPGDTMAVIEHDGVGSMSDEDVLVAVEEAQLDRLAR